MSGGWVAVSAAQRSGVPPLNLSYNIHPPSSTYFTLADRKRLAGEETIPLADRKRLAEGRTPADRKRLAGEGSLDAPWTPSSLLLFPPLLGWPSKWLSSRSEKSVLEGDARLDNKLLTPSGPRVG